MAQVRFANGAAQATSSSTWRRVARTFSWASSVSASSMANAVCDPFGGPRRSSPSLRPPWSRSMGPRWALLISDGLLGPLLSHTSVRSPRASNSFESQSALPTAGSSRAGPPGTSDATNHSQRHRGHSIRQFGRARPRAIDCRYHRHATLSTRPLRRPRYACATFRTPPNPSGSQ
jgi:hypothetical protein